MKKPTWPIVQRYLTREHGMLGTIADLFGLIGVVMTCWVLFTDGDIPQVVLACSLAFLAFASVFYAVATSREVSDLGEQLGAAKDTSSAVQLRWTSLSWLEQAIEQMARANVTIGRGHADIRDRVPEYLDQMCRLTAEAMTGVTGHPCRVTIQETYAVMRDGAPQEAVRRLASSSYSRSAGARGGDVDWVSDITDFETIYNELEQHYLCNDIPDELQSGYRNSHWRPEQLAMWKLDGNYPYRSTLVLPIAGPTDGATSEHALIGFLSIDSREVGVFDPAVANVVGRIVAAGAYANLMLYRTWRKDNEQ